MRTRAADIAAPGRDTVRRRTPNDVDESVMVGNTIVRGPAAVLRARVLGANGVLALQRSAGNRATGELLSRLRVPGITAQRDEKDPPAVPRPVRHGDGLLPAHLWLKNPEEFLRTRPLLTPQGGLPLLPPSQVTGLINWGDIGTAYRDRRLVLQTRDRSVIIGHWQRWYPVAQALYKVPGAKLLFDTPAAIMNTMTAKMIDLSLAGDNPNTVEILDREAERFGGKTSTGSVTLIRF